MMKVKTINRNHRPESVKKESLKNKTTNDDNRSPISKKNKSYFFFHGYILFYQKTAHLARRRKSGLPSSKLIIILENKDYMTMMKEKLIEIKQVCRSLKLTSAKQIIQTPLLTN